MQALREPPRGAADPSNGPDGRLLRDRRSVTVPARPERAFEPIRRIGGKTGWYYADWLWKLRGAMDRVAGGTGMSRGRRHPNQVKVGDVIDCWRVDAFEPNRRLRLFLELRQPGRGWLEFEVVGNGSGSTIHLTATYDPQGFLGKLHWILVSPLHHLIFTGMLRRIAAHVAPAASTRSA